jgi:hypothetical protein
MPETDLFATVATFRQSVNKYFHLAPPSKFPQVVIGNGDAF